jgi:hypothetical protein
MVVNQEPDLYRDKISDLVAKLDKCIRVLGEYVLEK